MSAAAALVALLLGADDDVPRRWRATVGATIGYTWFEGGPFSSRRPVLEPSGGAELGLSFAPLTWLRPIVVIAGALRPYEDFSDIHGWARFAAGVELVLPGERFSAHLGGSFGFALVLLGPGALPAAKAAVNPFLSWAGEAHLGADVALGPSLFVGGRVGVGSVRSVSAPMLVADVGLRVGWAF